MITEKQHQEWKRDLEELHKVQAENERQAKALQIAADYISGMKGVCSVGNAREALNEIEQALQDKAATRRR